MCAQVLVFHVHAGCGRGAVQHGRLPLDQRLAEMGVPAPGVKDKQGWATIVYTADEETIDSFRHTKCTGGGGSIDAFCLSYLDVQRLLEEAPIMNLDRTLRLKYGRCCC